MYFSNDTMEEDLATSSETWPTKNEDWDYNLMGAEGADDFVRSNYRDRPEIKDIWFSLSTRIFKADFLRYLVLESLGGVYTDLDTEALQPASEWAPEHLRSRTRAIVGIEADLVGMDPVYGLLELQFAQWTMAAAPGHPIMKKVVANSAERLQQVAKKQGVTIAELQPGDNLDVIWATGPWVWTDSIFEALSETTGMNITGANITGLIYPKLFGDILVLPPDGFGTGQAYPGSTNGGNHPPTALAMHHFKGSWKNWGANEEYQPPQEGE